MMPLLLLGEFLTVFQDRKGKIPPKQPFSNIVNLTSISRLLENGDRPPRRENPHKYLLYKPTLSQVLVFLASGFKELPANGALLLYISADGCFSTTKHPEDSKILFIDLICL